MNSTAVEPRTSQRTRLALATTSGYFSLLLAQLCLPFLAGIVVRIPFDTPFVRSSVEIARDMEASVQSVRRSELFYNSTSHYSEQGNALVAEVAVRALLDGQ